MKKGGDSRLSDEYSDQFRVSNEKIVDDFCKILGRFVEKNRDLKFIVFNTTDHHLKTHRFITGLESAIQGSDSTKALFKNVYPVDITDDINESDHFILDWHLNQAGYQKIAKRLTEKIALIAHD